MQLKLKPRLVLALCICAGLAACQSTPAHDAGVGPIGVLLENPAQPEPLEIPLQTEIAIARSTEMLSNPGIPNLERARLFYDRGVLYDSVGLHALARLDITRALKLKPDLADAYNFVGIHQTLSGDFDQAYESFDATLELNPDYQFAYLNRAIAFLYDGKIDLAITDFQAFQRFDPKDSYRALWRYIGDYAKSPELAKEHLLASQADLSQTQWARHVVAFYLGQISEQQLISKATADVESPKQLAEQLCELYFYLAKWHAMQRQPTQAANYFKLALSTNVYEFVEHRYARIELQLLRMSVVDHHDAP